MIPNNVDKIGQKDYETWYKLAVEKGEDAAWEYLDNRLCDVLDDINWSLEQRLKQQELQRK